MTYKPQPKDTKSIVLDKELLELLELLAKNNHDVWASSRIAEGWTYGEAKDSRLKTTPCLFPYEDLPESEKEYDRNTCLETLRFIKAMGYEIIKKEL